MKTWNDYFKLPFTILEDGVYSSDGYKILDLCCESETNDKIIDLINGKYSGDLHELRKAKYYEKQKEIREERSGNVICKIGGEELLKEEEFYNLPHDIADNMRDTLAAHIVNIINNNL